MYVCVYLRFILVAVCLLVMSDTREEEKTVREGGGREIMENFVVHGNVMFGIYFMLGW